MVLQNPKDYGLREKRSKQKTQRNRTKSRWSYHKGKKVNKSGVYYNDAIVQIKNKKRKRSNEEKTTENQEKCSICYQSSDKITFINCKRGGVQIKNHGRSSACCKDKPICRTCRQKCMKSCPFCRNHKLHIIETVRYPKKKQPWAIREILRYEKIREKKKKDEIEKYKLQRWDAEWERTSAWQRIYTNSTGLVSTSREDNVFGGFYSNFDYTSIF